jgi:hypothetical protein
MSGFGNPIVGALGRLIRQAIQSANFVTGQAGWQVTQQGSAEFNDVTVRGTVEVDSADGSAVLLVPNAGGRVEFRPKTVPGQTAVVNGFIFSSGIEYDAGGSGGYAFMTFGTPGFNDANGKTSPATMELLTASSDGSAFPGFTVANSMLEVPGDIYTHGGILTGFIHSTGAAQFDTDVTVDGDLVLAGGIDGVGALRYVEVGSLTKTASTVAQDIPLASGSVPLAISPGTWWIDTVVAYDGPTAADARFSWATSGPTIARFERTIIAPASGTASNENTSMVAIRRAAPTQELVGTPAGVANGFTAYTETAIVVNPGPGDATLTLQFAQGTSNATPSVVQSGTIRAQRVR